MHASLIRWTSGLLAVGALLAGCASMSDQQCRTTNWYELGENDALVYGLRPRIDQFTYQCSKFGVQPDEKQYLAGWQVGAWEHSIRVSGADCCGSR
jgi:Protein of unknown function (DUF2799)